MMIIYMFIYDFMMMILLYSGLKIVKIIIIITIVSIIIIRMMILLYDGLKMIRNIFSCLHPHPYPHPHRYHHHHHHRHHHHHDDQPISPHVSPLFLGGTLAKGTRPECNNKCTVILYHFKSFHIIVYN